MSCPRWGPRYTCTCVLWHQRSIRSLWCSSIFFPSELIVSQCSPYLKQIKHGLQLIYTVRLEGLMKGKLTSRPPALFDKQAGKVMMCENSFSDQNWGNAMWGLTCTAECHSDAQLNVIVRKVQHTVHELMPEVGGKRVDEESDDEYACICKSCHCSAEWINICSGPFSTAPLPWLLSLCRKSCVVMVDLILCPSLLYWIPLALLLQFQVLRCHLVAFPVSRSNFLSSQFHCPLHYRFANISCRFFSSLHAYTTRSI